MGIERFFSSLNRQFNVVTDLTAPYTKIDATHFLIDFNSIIHNVSSQMLSELNKFKQKKIENLSFHFTNMDDFEPQIIIQVKEYIKNLLRENFISENITYLMLAIDGVPSFAKMMEQKKRRYIGDLMTKLMKSVELPVEWSKNNISPGTKFMNTMSQELKDRRFLDECKEICSNIEGILVSDIYNPGEGEMKIMTCLRNLKSSSNKICVYSPDSDMILLLMILDIETVLLRFDQQKSKIENKKIFNLINVQQFKGELIRYCKERVDLLDNDRLLIDEIIYIFTLFGDDFLPKLESINVGEDINTIIDNYLLTLIDVGNILETGQHGGSINLFKSGKTLLKKQVDEDSHETNEVEDTREQMNRYSINHDNLIHFFSLLTKNELIDINRNFYNSKYKNYTWARNNNFNKDLTQFKYDINNIITKFVVSKSMLFNRTGQVCTTLNATTCIDVQYFYDFFKSELDKTYKYNKKSSEFDGKSYEKGKGSDLERNIYSDLLTKIMTNQVHTQPYYNFVYNILKIIDGHHLYHTLYGDGILGRSLLGKRSKEFQDKINKYKSLYYLQLSNEEIIEELVLYMYLQPLQFPFNNFRLESTTIFQKYDERSFKSKDHKNKMKKNELLNKGKERDQLEYIMNNKLDDFFYLFNPEHSFYKSKIRNLNEYYTEFFPNKNKEEIIDKYIEGFEWVLNYYFNDKMDSMWYYPYIRTPLLSDIISLYKPKTDTLNFNQPIVFNPLESIIFISPLEPEYPLTFFPDLVSDEIKEKIQEFMISNRHFFLPLSEINIKLQTNMAELTDLLDCSVSIFLSKCHFKLLEGKTDPILFIEKFRKVIPLEEQPLKNINTFKCVNLRLN
jgi:5'-3' exonuclease